MDEIINERLKKDPEFKERLKRNPKEELKKLAGKDLDFEVVIHEDTPNKKHIVLSQKELATVVAGCWDWLHG